MCGPSRDWRLWCEDNGHKPGVGPPAPTTTAAGTSWMWRTVEASGPFRFPIEGPMMSDKSPRKSMSKKAGKSLKEKRADKKAKASEHTVIETAFHAKKR